MSSDSGSKRFMTRGLGQVLFNYLPDATFDYDRGSCICKVTELNLSPQVGIDRVQILQDIREYVKPWGDMTTLRPEDLKKPDLFTFGEPETVKFNVYPLTFKCVKCLSAFSYSNEKQFLSNPANRTCAWCGGKLIQIYHVLVHHCGHLRQLGVPSCKNHGGKSSRVYLDDRESQRARDFRWICRDCNSDLGILNRVCDVCKGEWGGDPEKKEDGKEGKKKNITMRPIPHRANAAYYAHHITRVNIGTEELRDLRTHPERERILVESYLKDSYKSDDLLEDIAPGKDQKSSMADKLRRIAADMPDGPERREILITADTMERLATTEAERSKAEPTGYDITADAFNELFEYVKLRCARKFTGIDEVKAVAETRRPGFGGKFDWIEDLYAGASIPETKLISDFPILTAVFGYTRVSFEPETTVGTEKVKTRFNAFPTIRDDRRDSLLDTTPIFVRTAETEALFIRFDPLWILRWLEKRLPGTVGSAPNSEREARLWLLKNVGGVDRFVTDKGMSETTRYVFGFLHTTSHMFMRAAASLAGIDRTGLGEYLFPRMGAMVIYNSHTVFNLGGVTTLFEEELELLLENVRSNPLARECVYDPVCSDHMNSSCHACTHLGEMSCSFFNRGMSREFLFGPKGFWSA